MNESEHLALRWFSKNHSVELNYNDPPDFVLDRDIALEVVGIHHPFIDNVMEYIRERLRRNRFLVSSRDYTHFIDLSVDYDKWDSGDKSERVSYRSDIEKAVLLAAERVSKGIESTPQSYEINLDEIEVRVLTIRAQKHQPIFLVGTLTALTGELVIDVITDEIRSAVSKKIEKCSGIDDPMYKSWWLAITNHLHYRIETEDELIATKAAIPKIHPFQKIMLLDCSGTNVVCEWQLYTKYEDSKVPVHWL